MKVEKEERGPSLGLRRRRDVAFYGKVAQKVAHLFGTKFLRVPAAMEVDEAARPIDIRLLGPIRVMSGSDCLAESIA